MNENKGMWIGIIIAAFIVGGFAGFGLSLLGTKPLSSKGTISLYPPTVSQAHGQWLAKIDNYVITKSEFDEGISFLISQMPESQKAQIKDPATLKKLYFDTLINQYIVTIEALKKGILDKKDTRLLLTAAIRQAVYQVYLNQQVTDPSSFTPTEIELNQAYQQYGAQMRKMGYPASQIKGILKQQLSQQKLKRWEQQFVAAARDQYKIEKNEKLLSKEGIEENSGLPGLNMAMPTNK